MKLHSRIAALDIAEPVILRVTETANRPIDTRRQEVLIPSAPLETKPEGFPLILSRPEDRVSRPDPQLPPELSYLREGDILRFSPSGEVAVLYRKSSPHNAMLITERCNSKCLMCSQPPRDANDSYLIDDWLTAIPLMSRDTAELGITGGEPTLCFDGLLQIIASAKENLPNTALHILSNGRLFAYLKYAEQIAEIQHPDLMIGIPLYADVDDIHDFVVQAKGAFSQTIRGILNLGRVKQRIEIRFVLHRQTFERLPQFSRFVTRNLPFVHHVALMGLEIIGYTRSNLDALWIDPVEYQQQLDEAVFELACGHMNVSVYNLPLCLLPQSAWPYARRSISDWKNIFLEECQSCTVKEYCAGFFASAQIKRSCHIHALGDSERDYATSCMR